MPAATTGSGESDPRAADVEGDLEPRLLRGGLEQVERLRDQHAAPGLDVEVDERVQVPLQVLPDRRHGRGRPPAPVRKREGGRGAEPVVLEAGKARRGGRDRGAVHDAGLDPEGSRPEAEVDVRGRDHGIARDEERGRPGPRRLEHRVGPALDVVAREDRDRPPPGLLHGRDGRAAEGGGVALEKDPVGLSDRPAPAEREVLEVPEAEADEPEHVRSPPAENETCAPKLSRPAVISASAPLQPARKLIRAPIPRPSATV